MARTLASEPKILLMDEPFAALDEQTRLLLGDKVLQIQQQLKQTTLLITHNITEAVQLADRILVMTYRPGRVKRIVDIELPRPRTSEIVSSEAFGRYVAQIWSDLREEASRGMSDDEAARCTRRSKGMSAAALAARRMVPPAIGLGSLVYSLADRNSHPHRRDQSLHRAAAVGDRGELSGASSPRKTFCDRFLLTAWECLDRRRVAHRIRRRDRRLAASRSDCCVLPAKTGSRRWRRRRWCWPIRCSWCCSGAAR